MSDIQQARERLYALLEEKSYPKLEKALGVNRSYLYDFVEKGVIPKNKRVREAMGIDLTSEGARRYQAANAKARAAGWNSWSEYTRAVIAGKVPILRPDE